MSRNKFEEWCANNPEPESAYQIWLAGRESMRDEAANECANEWDGDSDTYEYSLACNECADAIKRIEP